MTASLALQSRSFLIYAVIVACGLIVAGAILAFFKWVLRRDVQGVWLTYRSWLVMFPLIFAAVFAGRETWVLAVTLLSIAAFKEFARATGLYRDWWMTGAVYLGILAVGASSLVYDPFKNLPGWWGLFLAMPVYVISLLLIMPIVRNRVTGMLQAMSLAMLGFIYIGWMFGHLGFLANSYNPYGFLLFVVLTTEFNDIAAFVFGRALGKHPLRSNVSPKKTWEGAIGAAMISLAAPWLLRFSLPDFTPGELILAGLIIGLGGQLGDLCISVIKRDIGIKDTGATIPGHGGVLDRIDSLIFVAPLFLHLVQYGHGLRGDGS